MKNWFEKDSYLSYFILSFILGMHFLACFTQIFNGDSSLYASISKSILEHHDPVVLRSYIDPNWIDKPHFIFWIWSLSYSIFGFTSFAFKFPAFLALLFLLYQSYQYTRIHYNHVISLRAILILASACHVYISISDTRLDIFLIAFIMASVRYFHFSITQKSWRHLVLGGFFAGLAVSSKGMIALIPISAAVLSGLYYNNNWRQQRIIPWILSFVIFILTILPELYAVNLQYRLVENSLVLGEAKTNFLQFFFWDSQFGRFQSNRGLVSSTGDKSFFIHSILWAFFPWSFEILRSIFCRQKPAIDLGSIAAVALCFLIISLSTTQLSHHVLIVFPFLSIIVSASFENKWPQKWSIILWIISFSIFSLITVVLIVFGVAPWKMTCWSLLCLVELFMILRISKEREFHSMLLLAIYLGGSLTFVFYPRLLTFQSGKYAATAISNYSKNSLIYQYGVNPDLMHSYMNRAVKTWDDQWLKNKKAPNCLLYTNADYCEVLKKNQINFKTVDSFNEYRTTVLSMDFILDSTKRNSLLKKTKLVEINPKH